MFRGSLRSSFKWSGIVGRLVGVALLPLSIPARAGRSEACDLDDSPSRTPRDLDDVEKFRGSLDFPQWRISPREVLVANSNSPIPAGQFAQPLFNALADSYFS